MHNTLNDYSLATAVKSYARIAMSRVKLDILTNGGSIYYIDTDSIVTLLVDDKLLPDTLIGDAPGGFKLIYVALDDKEAMWS